MKQKIEIIKTIELNDDLVLIVGKKIKTEPKKCGHCEHIICDHIKRICYCRKHQGIVSMEDTCIEEGM